MNTLLVYMRGSSKLIDCKNKHTIPLEIQYFVYELQGDGSLISNELINYIEILIRSNQNRGKMNKKRSPHILDWRQKKVK
jgi:hypothetical protein